MISISGGRYTSWGSDISPININTEDLGDAYERVTHTFEIVDDETKRFTASPFLRNQYLRESVGTVEASASPPTHSNHPYYESSCHFLHPLSCSTS
ncbi:hypothetical protein NT6N_16020 [Oceaniferula spumae]|uniref:Uncharacterized protein n=1 Tax=Oceaniferula spumae TaxID=2979115 RepID=A0AAT9FKD6_9BACT